MCWTLSICPGRILAEEVAFTVIALLLSLFDISNAHDTNGDPIIPPLEQTEGSIVYVMSLAFTFDFSRVSDNRRQAPAAVPLRDPAA